ncbi:hypothetical protein FBU30_009842 [Linnemannia zychae]|nr:hypothetical protein FBU30_009842 [Linnemannia zychae]
MPKTETSTQDSARPTPSAIETKKPVFSMSKLAPEIILIILSSLDYYDNPSRLLPILIMCKSWARLALELIYEQPFLTLKSIPSFITTLGLQDRLQDGKTPFWETNIHLDGVKSLGIDYRSLIKKPCRIVGSSPTKLDLVQLWDLQAVLWTVPGLAVSRGSINTGLSLSNGTSSPSSSPPQSPLSLSSSPTSPVQSSPSPSPRLLSPMPTSTVAAAATTVTASVVRTAEAGSIEVTRPISPPRRTASSSPSTPKPVLVRRKKKALPPPGPIVMMLESTAVYSEILNEVLREVPGMKLRHLHYRLIPNIPLLELLKNHISTLQELTITRSPIRITEFAAIAQEISGSTNTINNCSSSSNGGGHEDAVNGTVAVQEQYPQTRHQSHIHTLALNFCQGAGMTVLTDLMRACGPRLRTLEFRKHTVVRPVAGAAGEGVNDPAQAPINVFGGNWDEQERAREAFERELKEFPSKSTCEPGQVCKGCGSVDKSCHNSDQTQLDDKTETTVNDLFIAMPTEATSVNEAESNVEQQQEQQQQHQQGAGSHPVGVDPETRMDLAMLAISENCPGLTCLRLQNMTWLTDNSLSGFQPADNIFPTVHSQQQKQQQYDQQHRGLKEIELLNSYYGSKVTIEGLLEICGPELETLSRVGEQGSQHGPQGPRSQIKV